LAGDIIPDSRATSPGISTLVYPIATIFIMWAVSGHVGPAAAALRLKPDLPGWQRSLATAAVGCQFCIAWWHSPRTGKALLWLILIFTVVSASAYALVGTAAVIACVAAIAVKGSLHVPGAGAAGVLTAVFYSLIFAVSGSYSTAHIVVALAIIGGTGIVVVAIERWGGTALRRGWQGPFLLLFVLAMILSCLGAAGLLSHLDSWKTAGVVLLFLGLFTLLNAPFDWASLGLTRALLRRGLELGGWWPYGFAVVDAALAGVIIAALALTMVVGVQAFDALAVHGGGSTVLPLDALFTGIAEHPSASEYWWLYALLLSTMIPSLVNLVISGASLVRGLPGVSWLLLRYIPERGGVPKWDRHWIATVLTFQVASGAALGIAAQVLLVVVIIGYVLPWFGPDLLGIAEAVAAFNLPARVGQLLGGVP
jgi:hypothetical protein